MAKEYINMKELTQDNGKTLHIFTGYRGNNMTYEYRVVRSYAHGNKTGMNDLVNAFNAGFEFVRASEAVNNSKGCFDYIEYILKRKVNDDQTT